MHRFQAARAELRWGDRYGVLLMGALASYAMVGKSFAYLGVAPVYVTELLLAAGLVVMLQTRCMLASLVSVPSLLMVGLIGLTLLRTLPFVHAYGVDALRDSVLVVYGLFAFIVSTLLLQRPECLVAVLRFLRWLTGLYVFVGPAIYLVNVTVLPRLPPSMSNLPLPWLRAGELGVHTSGCALLALVGLRTARPAWLCALVFAIILVASQNRGGLLAILVPVVFTLPFTRAWPRVVAAGIAVVLVLSLAYVADLQVPFTQVTEEMQTRPLGARQAVDNVLSLVGSSANRQLDDTKMFRELWWRKIWNYTVYGSYFWTGKGFGVNLAVDDNSVVGDPRYAPLRSPHNSHMNVLARTGVPGIVLWASFMLTWFGTVIGSALSARRRGDEGWGKLLLFVACYWLSNVVNASFDVALEGPMLGVWFWCQTGLGLGAVAIYRAARVPAGRSAGLHDHLRRAPATSGIRRAAAPSR